MVQKLTMVSFPSRNKGKSIEWHLQVIFLVCSPGAGSMGRNTTLQACDLLNTSVIWSPRILFKSMIHEMGTNDHQENAEAERTLERTLEIRGARSRRRSDLMAIP